MGQPVSADDLPANLVPASDLPEGNAVAATPSAPQAAQADVRKVDQQITHVGPRTSLLRNVGTAARRAINPTAALEDAQPYIDKAAYYAGEKVSDAATAMGLPPTPAAVAGTAANVGVQAIPMAVGGQGLKSAAAPLAQRAGRALMQKALKPSKAARGSGDAERAIQTLLDEGANVTKGGVEKLTKAIDDLDDAVTRAVANAGTDVSTLSVMRPIKEAIERLQYGNEHAASEKAIRGEMLKFFDNPHVQGALNIPAQTAQKIKQALYKEAGEAAYKTGAKPTAEMEGKKAVARGLKEGIERAVTGTKELNTRMESNINARDLAQERVLQAGNNNLVGLGWLNPAQLIPWLADRSPLAMSLGARSMHSGGAPRVAGQLGGAVEGAYSGRPPKQP